MNITVIQNKSQRETLGSGGANIIEKLYELATDSNNSLTLEGWIKSPSAYGYLVDYLNTHFNDLEVETDNRYIKFQDNAVLNALLSQGVGDGTGITMSDLDGITLDGNGGTGKVTFRNNTDIEYFEEFKYFTNGRVSGMSPFYGCSNLKLISFPLDYTSAGGWFLDVFCSFVVPSLKWFLEYGVSEWALPRTGNWDIPEENWGDIYIGNTNNKLEDVIVTSDIVVSPDRILRNSNIKTLRWETDSNIPDNFCILCKKLNSLTITAQNVQIGQNAFYECEDLLTIDGFSNISAFKGDCFYNCRKAVSDASLMQSSITSIGAEAFYNNTKMTGSINLPNLVSLGNSSFGGTGISSIVNLGSITRIPNLCFNSCTNLTSVVLPNSCIVFQEGAFNRCSSLSQINLSNRIIEFGRYCFTECSSLNISASVLTNATIIGESAFNGIASLSGDLVLSHLTEIGGWPFGNRTLGITSADFTGSTFTQINAGLFENQTSLDHVILPATLTTIDAWGHFSNAPLRWIKFLGTTAPTGRGVNSMEIRAAAKIYVPDAAVNDYKASLTKYASLIYGMSLFATDFPNG